MISFFLLSCSEDQITKSTHQYKIDLETLDTLQGGAISEIQYLDSLFLRLGYERNSVEKREVLFKLALKYYNLSLYGNYLRASMAVHQSALADADSLHIAKSKYYLGDYYEAVSTFDSALIYYRSSEQIYKLRKDSLNWGKVKLYKAGILYDVGSFEQSEIEAVQALKLIDVQGNTRLKYEALQLIALSLKELDNYSESLSYFYKAIDQLSILEMTEKDKNILFSKAACYNNIGLIYSKMGLHYKALEKYEKARKTPEINSSRLKLYTILLTNISYSRLQLGDTLGIYNELISSMRLKDSIDFKPGIVSSKTLLGEYFLFKKDTLAALKELQEAYRLAKEINSGYDMKYTLKLLSANDKLKGGEYSEQLLRISDSVNRVDRATRNKFTRIAYETSEIQKRNDVLMKRESVIFSIVTVTALVLSLLFLLYRLKIYSKSLLAEKRQQDADKLIYQMMIDKNSEMETARKGERQRISQDLHDGVINSIFTIRYNLAQLSTANNSMKDNLLDELTTVESQIRQFSHDLSQNAFFNSDNFPEMLSILIESQKNTFNTVFDSLIDKGINWESLSVEKKISLYRILQEAFQNIHKYSQATQCMVTIMAINKNIKLTVRDNGVGFNLRKVKMGLGIKNMKNRISAVGGSFNLETQEGMGALIVVVL